MSEIIGYSNSSTTCTSVKLTDLELAKQDLANMFSITKGEKWTNPEFGTNIPFYLFEPLDDSTRDLIEEEVITVVENDVRFRLTDSNIEVLDDGHSVNVSVNLIYIPLDTYFTLQLQFDREDTGF
jgi:phage baseplate assembly protein W